MLTFINDYFFSFHLLGQDSLAFSAEFSRPVEWHEPLAIGLSWPGWPGFPCRGCLESLALAVPFISWSGRPGFPCRGCLESLALAVPFISWPGRPGFPCRDGLESPALARLAKLSQAALSWQA